MPNEPLPVWRLDYEDKVIHHEMARAHTYMLHVARAIREHKAGDPDWLARADEIAGAAGILGGWMEGLRIEAAEGENGKENEK